MLLILVQLSNRDGSRYLIQWRRLIIS